MAADDIKDAISQSAQDPRTAEVDGVRVTQHSLSEQIAADRYIRGLESGSNPGSVGFRVSRLTPPGATGE